MAAEPESFVRAERQIPPGNDWLTQEDLARLAPGDLIGRTRALKPLVAANAERAEQIRRPVDEVWQALRASGLFYHFVPKRFGGLEFDVDTFIDAVLPIAEGCASTGWTASFCMEHNWMLAQFPEEGQASIFSKFPYIIAPAVTKPPGLATPVPGGFRVSGHWKWGTGVMHADWVLLGALAAGVAPPQMLLVAIPAKDVDVRDTWYASGMVGTGSNDIIAHDIFVPQSHVTDFGKMRAGTAFGAAIHQNPMYRMPMLPFLTVAAAIPVLGAARSALEMFRSHMSTRPVIGTQLRQKDRPASQMRLASASLMVETAEGIVRDVARKNLALAEQAGTHDSERIRLRARTAYAVQLCREAVTRVVEASGASAQMLNNPIQRALRDIQTISSHVVFDMDAALELEGRSLLDLPPNAESY